MRAWTCRNRRAAIAAAFLCASLAAFDARSASLFVDDDAVCPCDGTKARPYATISAALADLERIAAEQVVVVHVAAGLYDAEPAWPVVLARPKLRLLGATRLDSSSGFPSPPAGDREQTRVRPFPAAAPPGPPPPIPTAFRVVADEVTVQGFTFVGPGTSDPRFAGTAATVDIDGSKPAPASPQGDVIEGVAIRGCFFDHGRVALRSTHAGVTVEGNFAIGHFNGMNFLAGPAGARQLVIVRGNRVLGSQAAGIILHGQSRIANRSGEQWVEVYENDFSDNGRPLSPTLHIGTGIQVFGENDSGPGQPIPAPNQLLPAFLAADLHDNRFIGNRSYGITVNCRALKGAPGSPSTIWFEEHDNTFCGNGNNDVIVASQFFASAMCPLIPTQLRHLRNARWDVSLAPGTGWDTVVAAGNPEIVVNGEPVNPDRDLDLDGLPIVSRVTAWPGGADYCTVSTPTPPLPPVCSAP